MTLRVIDAFCGAGGLSLGFKLAGGFEAVCGIDSDRAAAQSYALNFDARVVHAHIAEWLSNSDVPPADLVVAGLPCQAFSLLNKNRRNDPRSSLWRHLLETVLKADARAFLIENVGEMLTSAEFVVLERQAEKMGFKVESRVLNAADYGTPQTRKRAIVVGWRPSSVHRPEFPPVPSHSQTGDQLPHWRTVRDAISDLPPPVGVEIRGVASPEDLHFGRSPTEVSRARYRAVPPGGNRFDLQRAAPELTPECWIRKTSGGTDLFGRLWWNRPSVTIRTEFFKPEKGRYLHPEEHRPITHREAARLMGFPDSFKFCGTKIDVAKQIGNAVPPPMALALAQMMGEALSRGIRTPRNGLARPLPANPPIKHQYSPPSTHSAQ